jgi:hypothetical protein
MAQTDALSETRVANMALARIGAKRIADIDSQTDKSNSLLHVQTHFAQTRQSLIRSHWWNFAKRRETLSANTTDPDFEWDNAYDWPADCLRIRHPFDSDSEKRISRYSYDVEARQILSDESTMEIRYIADVTDPTQWDSLFVEVFVLTLALKLVMPLRGDRALRVDILNELELVMRRVRLVDKQEANTIGVYDRHTWNRARLVGRGDPTRRYS